MSTTEQNPLTQLSRSLQVDNQRFQQDLTGAFLQASQDPAAALLKFNQCWTQADTLEHRMLDFLAKMGDFGAQQTATEKDSWRANRLQILVGKAQVLVILARYDECQSAIDSARSYLAGSADDANSILDQLEIAILQMRS